MRPLAIIPSYAREEAHLQMLSHAIGTLREHGEHVSILVVDDASPLEGSVDVAHKLGAGAVRLQENRRFSGAVNEGLRQALDEERDALLVNSDIVFDRPFLHFMEEDPADVVGALLYYPFGLVQHGGVYFSALTRSWDHLFRYAPLDLEEVQERRVCPVTAALTLIKLPVLETVGLYDEDYGLAFEDVDYCLRVFKAGMTCAYQPAATALHRESISRGDGAMNEHEISSWTRLNERWDIDDFMPWVYPPMLKSPKK